MLGIVWSRRSLRVILNRDHRKCAMAHAFDTLIVEVDVSDFNFRRKTLSAHGEAVVM
jgi:hypothetical protein